MDESSLPFTLILDDPADLSMISDRYTEHRNPAPEHEQRNDPNLVRSNSQHFGFRPALITNSRPALISNSRPNWCSVVQITEIYDRTDSQNEELGLADMKTEGYEEDWHFSVYI